MDSDLFPVIALPRSSRSSEALNLKRRKSQIGQNFIRTNKGCDFEDRVFFFKSS